MILTVKGWLQKKNRRFEDILQIGEGWGVKLKPEIQNDFNFRQFWGGGGGVLSLCQNFNPCIFTFFESLINILSFVIRFLRTFLCNYYLVLSLCEFLSMKMKSAESLQIKERITMKRYQNCYYKICTKNLFLSKFR